MKELELKSKHTFAATELGDFLRKLASALDGKADSGFTDLQDNLGDYSKLVLKIKRKNASVVMRLKARLPAPETAPAAAAGDDSLKTDKPKYKTLKKRMKSDFKALAESIALNEFPDARMVESFIADSELMTTYPGYGDDHYDVFRKALVEFAEAFEKRDIVLLDKRFLALKQLMAECHKLYK
jgi:XXXCH domain-containing protein